MQGRFLLENFFVLAAFNCEVQRRTPLPDKRTRGASVSGLGFRGLLNWRFLTGHSTGFRVIMVAIF